MTNHTPQARDLFGQPRALTWLSATQFWEAFSLYATQAVLLLYMVEALLVPGHIEHITGFAGLRSGIESVTGPLSNQSLAVQIFGLFAGLARFSPLFGGFIGDRWLGRRNTVIIGAVMMIAGQFALAFDKSFLVALLLIMLGAGCLNPNLFSQLGSIFAPGDRRRDDGLQIYYAALNTGAFVSPIVCGWIGVEWGWHSAFVVAGMGMAVGLVVYVAGTRHLPHEAPRIAAAERPPLSRDERRTVALLVVLVLVSATFWIAQSQVWNVYNLWLRDHVTLTIAGWTIPVPWFQAIDALAPVLMLPPVIALWRWQAARGVEPDAITKLAIGCLIFGTSMAWLAVAEPLFGQHVPLLWAIAFHVLDNLGWIYFTPIAVGLYARGAPKSMNAMMIGLNTMSVFVGSTISGRLGALYESLSPARFWLIHAGIVGGGALLFLALRPAVRLMLAGADARSAGG